MPATYSPASLLFPFSLHDSPAFPPSSSASALSLPPLFLLLFPLLASLFLPLLVFLPLPLFLLLLPSLPTGSVSSSSSSFSPNYSLTNYNTGKLGLSQDYRKLANYFFLHNFKFDRSYVYHHYPALHDFERDHQGGESVFLGSLRVSSSSLAPPLTSSSPVAQTSLFALPPLPPASLPSFSYFSSGFLLPRSFLPSLFFVLRVRLRLLLIIASLCLLRVLFCRLQVWLRFLLRVSLLLLRPIPLTFLLRLFFPPPKWFQLFGLQQSSGAS